MTDHCPIRTCPNVFDRVTVSYLIRGQTRVMWDLLPDFTDPLPYTFQLQVGNVDSSLGEWENVGLPVENSFYAIDDQQRVYGKSQFTHYRVKLTTIKGVYYSEPTGLLGVLNRRDWRLAREIVRKERLRNRLATADGYLFKRRMSGFACTRCTEFQTDEAKDPTCSECYGTGYQCGYYYPMSCVWADLNPKSSYMRLDTQGYLGMVSEVVIPARMLMIPLLSEYDVWVNIKTDDRYFIRRIQNIAELRGVPLIAQVELCLAPYTDIIYTLPLPE